MALTLNIGAHVSVAGGLPLAVQRAAACEFTCFQIFTHTPRAWAARAFPAAEVEEFARLRRSHGMAPVVVHAPYLPNLGSPDETLWKRSIAVVAADLAVADGIGADLYVLHPGSAMGRGAAWGIERVSAGLGRVFDRYAPRLTFLLENTAGAGATLGVTWDELAAVIERVTAQHPAVALGVCLDTAHCFAAGTDLRAPAAIADMLAAINGSIGRERLALIHANDSASALGSHCDRHAHIGCGCIGRPGFANLLAVPQVRALPWIMETPKDNDESDRENRRALLGIDARQQTSARTGPPAPPQHRRARGQTSPNPRAD